MGYKVGDEVLVKAVINDIGVGEVSPYEVKAVDNTMCGSSTRVIYVREEDVLPVSDMTAEEAWDIARKIVLPEDEGGIPVKDMVHIFGVKFPRDIVREYSVQEVKTKIEALEAEKEIKVGDIVMNEGLKCVVTRVSQDRVYTISKIGTTPVYCGEHIKKLKKTGRHIDIDELLNQIGGDE